MDQTTGPAMAMSSDEAQRILRESTDRPHEGRVYDYFLGGVANYAADRTFANKQISLLPDIPWAARQNRALLKRVIQHMINNGVRQFIDFGSGLPTQGNVHQIANQYGGDECRVIYIDHDPIAAAHAYLLLEKSGQLERNLPINGDFLLVEELWDTILESGLINLEEPVGLLMFALLHFLPDDEKAKKAVAFARDQVPSGSFLALSHASTDEMSEEAKSRSANVIKNYDQTTSRLKARTRKQIAKFFGDWDILDPGVVWIPEWTQPGLDEESLVGEVDLSRSQGVGAMARKP